MRGVSCAAIDMGASNGRVVVVDLRGGRLELRDARRFHTPQRFDPSCGHQCWDLDAIESRSAPACRGGRHGHAVQRGRRFLGRGLRAPRRRAAPGRARGGLSRRAHPRDDGGGLRAHPAGGDLPPHRHPVPADQHALPAGRDRAPAPRLAGPCAAPAHAPRLRPLPARRRDGHRAHQRHHHPAARPGDPRLGRRPPRRGGDLARDPRADRTGRGPPRRDRAAWGARRLAIVAPAPTTPRRRSPAWRRAPPTRPTSARAPGRSWAW